MDQLRILVRLFPYTTQPRKGKGRQRGLIACLRLQYSIPGNKVSFTIDILTCLSALLKAQLTDFRVTAS